MRIFDIVIAVATQPIAGLIQEVLQFFLDLFYTDFCHVVRLIKPPNWFGIFFPLRDMLPSDKSFEFRDSLVDVRE